VKFIESVSKETWESGLDEKAMGVFMKVLEVLGGPRRLFEFRNLTWLPALMEAAFVIVLANDYSKTRDEIASILGISKQTVTNILRASAQEAKDFIKEQCSGRAERPRHVAGALAKLAYEQLKRRQSNG